MSNNNLQKVITLFQYMYRNTDEEHPVSMVRILKDMEEQYGLSLSDETVKAYFRAIREYTDLGSGFKIAMRDLELRGAGNLLGAQQHGHMNAVGYDLYVKMLSQAVEEAKGIETVGDFDTTIDLTMDAYIPESYIKNEYQKLDIYKRIADLIHSEKLNVCLDLFSISMVNYITSTEEHRYLKYLFMGIM